MRKTIMKESKTANLCKAAAALAVAAGTLTMGSGEAEAQEILLTGPLAGAPAVRKLRLYRDKRFEIGPNLSFTLLDEYTRTMLVGLRANYNFTDWLAAGVFGQAGVVFINTHLTNETESVNAERRANPDVPINKRNLKITKANLGPNFPDQVGHIQYWVAPQLTLVPFRGKIALFEGIYLDTDLYFFGGPAFVGLEERGNCGAEGQLKCTDPDSFKRESRLAITGTFGIGLSLYTNKWNSLQIEWRAVPFSWNTSGFSTRQEGQVADSIVNEDDQQFKFNQTITLSYNFFFPMEYRVSE
jgi:hypothetical protein